MNPTRYRVVVHHPDEPRDFQRFTPSRDEADALLDGQMKLARPGSRGRIVETAEQTVREEAN